MAEVAIQRPNDGNAAAYRRLVQQRAAEVLLHLHQLGQVTGQHGLVGRSHPPALAQGRAHQPERFGRVVDDFHQQVQRGVGQQFVGVVGEVVGGQRAGLVRALHRNARDGQVQAGLLLNDVVKSLPHAAEADKADAQRLFVRFHKA